MRALVGRVDRIARELAPAAGGPVWMPADEEVDDGRICNVRTGETIDRGGVDRGVDLALV